MNAHEVLRKITRSTGMTDIELSVAMGKNTNYLGVIRNRKTIPRADTFAMIADASGYDLLVRNRTDNEEIVIDPS